MKVSLIDGSRFENEKGYRVDIQMKGSNIYYRVPEDMTPIGAQNQVAHGMANWIVRRDLSFSEKLTTAISTVKQKIQDRRNVRESAALRRDLDTASMVKAIAPPTRIFIDTGAAREE